MTMDNAIKNQDGENQTPGQNLPVDDSQTFGDEGQTSKIEDGKNYSAEEVRDILSADGRTQKNRAEAAIAENAKLKSDVTNLTTSVNSLTNQMEGFVKSQNDAEADKVKDDPVALGSLRARQANEAEGRRLQTINADYEANKAKLEERIATTDKKEVSINIKLAAIIGGVDEVKLAEIVPDGDPERLKKAVDIIKGSPETGDNIPAGLKNRPASTKTNVGGTSDLSADDKITHGLEQKRKK